MRVSFYDVTSCSPPHTMQLKANAMKTLVLLCSIIALVAVGAAASHSGQLVRPAALPYQADLLSRLRQAAYTVPGALPTRINYVKFAESHRPLADIIEGGSQQDFVSARTAFQVKYPTGSVMIDSGMDHNNACQRHRKNGC